MLYYVCKVNQAHIQWSCCNPATFLNHMPTPYTRTISIPGFLHEAITFYTLEEIIAQVESGLLDPQDIETAQGFCELPPK
jgi:hypothetical protein